MEVSEVPFYYRIFYREAQEAKLSLETPINPDCSHAYVKVRICQQPQRQKPSGG